MKSWKQYKKEKAEEKSGIDLDHDKEVGESLKHKEKIKKKKQEILDFFTKRKAGAAKIAEQATKKGGPAILTAWHFKIKAKSYAEVLKAIEEDKGEDFFLGKCKELISSIKLGKMSQKEFQEVLGELEVWGEILAKVFSNERN